MLFFYCSDSGDETIDSHDDDDASCISGGFINDGAYTQHPSEGGATQAGMYLAVNNYRMQMESPADFDSHGKPNVRKIFRSKRSMQLSVVYSSGGTSCTSDSMTSPVIEVPIGDASPGQDDRMSGGAMFDLSTLKPTLVSKERTKYTLPPIAKKLRFSTNAPVPLHRRCATRDPDISSDDSDDDPHVGVNPHTLKLLRRCQSKTLLASDENARICGEKGVNSSLSIVKEKRPYKVREPLGAIPVHENSKRCNTSDDDGDATLDV